MDMRPHSRDMIVARVLPRGSLFPPPSFEVRIRSSVILAIARPDSIHAVRFRTNTAIGILPHRPGAPARRDHRGRAVLGEPEPAIFQDGIDRRAQRPLDRMA